MREVYVSHTPSKRGFFFFYKRSVLTITKLPLTKSQLKKVHYYCSKIITPPCALLYHEYPYHAVSTHWLASRDNRSQSLNTRNKVLFRGKIATDNRWRRRGHYYDVQIVRTWKNVFSTIISWRGGFWTLLRLPPCSFYEVPCQEDLVYNRYLTACNHAWQPHWKKRVS